MYLCLLSNTEMKDNSENTWEKHDLAPLFSLALPLSSYTQDHLGKYFLVFVQIQFLSYLYLQIQFLCYLYLQIQFLSYLYLQIQFLLRNSFSTVIFFAMAALILRLNVRMEKNYLRKLWTIFLLNLWIAQMTESESEKVKSFLAWFESESFEPFLANASPSSWLKLSIDSRRAKHISCILKQIQMLCRPLIK